MYVVLYRFDSVPSDVYFLRTLLFVFLKQYPSLVQIREYTNAGMLSSGRVGSSQAVFTAF